MYVRVKHKELKHEFDVPEAFYALHTDFLDLVKRHPPAHQERPAKYPPKFASRPSASREEPESAVGEGTTSTETKE